MSPTPPLLLRITKISSPSTIVIFSLQNIYFIHRDWILLVYQQVSIRWDKASDFDFSEEQFVFFQFRISSFQSPIKEFDTIKSLQRIFGEKKKSNLIYIDY